MKLRFCGSKSGGSTAALLAISVTRGPGRPAVEPQNHSRRRTGKDVEEELAKYLWPPVRPGSGFAPQPQRVHAGAGRPEPLSPGDRARDRPSWGWGERRTWKQTDQSGNFQQAFSQGRSVVSECHMYSCFPRVRRQGKVYEAALLQVGKLSHVQTGFPPTQSGCLRTSLGVPGPFRPRQDPASRQAWRLPGQRPQGPRPFSLWPKRTR